MFFCSSVSTTRHQGKTSQGCTCAWDVRALKVCRLWVICNYFKKKLHIWVDKKFPTIFPWLLENENILHNFHFQMTSIYFHEYQKSTLFWWWKNSSQLVSHQTSSPSNIWNSGRIMLNFRNKHNISLHSRLHILMYSHIFVLCAYFHPHINMYNFDYKNFHSNIKNLHTICCIDGTIEFGKEYKYYTQVTLWNN